MSKLDGFQVGVDREDTLIMPPGASPASGAMHLFLGPADFSWGGLLSGVKGADGLPAWGSVARDRILRASRLVSGLWGSVQAKAITKMMVRGYTLDDQTDSQQRLNKAKQILESYGPGFAKGLARGMQDYLGTNMGQVIAIERVSNKPGAKITGLIHLDALRCTPTWSPDYPLLYWSPHGGVYLLPDWGVMRITDMPASDPLAFDYGQCASDRAWEAIIQDAAIQTYFREKITGSRNLSIFIIRGLTFEQLRDALTTSEADRESRNFMLYKGSTLIPLLSDTEVQLTEIPLAAVPDGFDVDQARDDIRLRMANAVGMAEQNFKALSGQGLGTGKQTEIQDDADEGMGLAAYPKLLAEAFNAKLFSESTTFKIFVNDIRDQKAKAEVQKLRAETRAGRIAAGEITPQEARQIALDDGDLPQELMQQDATPGGTLTSDDKPLAFLDQPVRVLLAAKEATVDVDAVVEAALNDRRAWEWARQAIADDARR